MRSTRLSAVKARPDLIPRTEVLGVSGSPRKNGNSDVILKSILAGVSGRNTDSTHFNLTDMQFQGCIGCERCRKDKICTGLVDGMSIVYETIISSKGLVLVSPTHNYNITSWMKAFIDRLYCFYNFDDDRPRSWSSQLAGQGRKAVVAAICEQKNKKDMGFTIEAMRLPLEALGYEIIGELSIFKIFEKAKVKHDDQALKKAEELGAGLAQALTT
ncbi:MAG: flavodoxin family protein [Desulfobulbaceae bacterium]|nr:MAG: flavodoxin family protein [Desulfobulbaceae bacterium]